MKKFLLVIIISFVGLQINGQVPEKFNYQGVLRNASGDLITNTNVTIQLSILEGSTSANASFIEQHNVTTNSYGQFAVIIGNGTNQTGSIDAIDWSVGQVYLKTELDESGGTTFTELSTVMLITVPYALYANDVANKDDADANPTNEIQQLYFKNDSVFISGGNGIKMPYDSSNWVISGNTMYYNGGNVGIGSSTPLSNLEVKSNMVGTDALFQVINANNDTVFAVYPDGVKIFVDQSAKGKVGGFAISGRSPNKGLDVDILKVTLDSTRIYVSDTASAKGKVGGFAISGRSPNKGSGNEYLVITPDSTRIYVNDSSATKGKVGGFAISGRSPNKGGVNDYFQVTRDSTRVYITESNTKGKIGGFAISGRSPNKGSGYEFMRVTADSTRIFTKDSVSGFGVSNLSSGKSESYMKLNPNNYFIGHRSGDSIKSGLYNSFFGYEAGYSTDDGDNNIFIGYRSGYTNDVGEGNLFIGNESGFSNMYGSSNVFMGYQAGYGNTEGDYNTYIGYQSAFMSSKGSYNTFVGYKSGNLNIGQSNVFMGYLAGGNSPGGQDNVFIGNQSGYITTSSANVFIGNETGLNNLGGSSNIFIGDESGKANVSGNYNVFLGRQAGFANEDGWLNVYLGNFAGQGGISGLENVFIGSESGRYATGDHNVFIGSRTGTSSVVIGDDNIFIGYNAGAQATGSDNIYLGKDAGRTSNGSNNIMIGYEYSGSNKLGISTLIYGDYSDFHNQIMRVHGKLRVGSWVDPVETLDVAGAIKIGYTTNTFEGTIRYTGSAFEGRTSSGWLPLSGYHYLHAEDLNPYNALYVDSEGKVGIGLTNPSDWLHVWSNSSTYKGLKISNGTPHLVLDNQTLNADDYEIIADVNNLYIKHDAADDGTFESTRLTLTSTGNLGIGTTPVEKLHVAGDIRLNAGGDIAFTDDNTSIYEDSDDLYFTADDDILFRPDDDIYIATGDNTTYWVMFDNANRRLGINSTSPSAILDLDNGPYLADPLEVNCYGTTKLFVDVSTGGTSIGSTATPPTNGLYVAGRLGIGTSTPDDELELTGDFMFTGGADRRLSLPDGTKTLIVGPNAYNTRPWGVLAEAAGYIALRVDGSTSKSLYLTDNGYVGVGISSPTNKFHVNEVANTGEYAAYIRHSGNSYAYHGLRIAAGAYESNGGTTYMIDLRDGDVSAVGSITMRNHTIYFNQTSDRRLKTNIQNTSIRGLEVIKNMPVVDFAFKESPDYLHTGFIAQDIQKVFPEAVSENQDGYLQLSLPTLVPILTKAIQEQDEKITKLEKENEALKQKLDEILELLKE